MNYLTVEQVIEIASRFTDWEPGKPAGSLLASQLTYIVNAAIQADRDSGARQRTTPRHTGHPDYCPDDLTEDVPCAACGASLENLLPCGAIHNGRKPGPLVELTVVKR